MHRVDILFFNLLTLYTAQRLLLKEILGNVTLQFCISGNKADLCLRFLFKFLVKQIYERFLENQKDLQTSTCCKK